MQPRWAEEDSFKNKKTLTGSNIFKSRTIYLWGKFKIIVADALSMLTNYPFCIIVVMKPGPHCMLFWIKTDHYLIDKSSYLFMCHLGVCLKQMTPQNTPAQKNEVNLCSWITPCRIWPITVKLAALLLKDSPAHPPSAAWRSLSSSSSLNTWKLTDPSGRMCKSPSYKMNNEA